MRTDTSRARTTSESGFTLLEVIAAIAILCFGLLAVASMQTGAIQGNYTARIQTEGTTWAQDRLEKLLALPYSDAKLADTAGAYTADPFPPSPAGYTIEYLVDDDNPTPNTKLIRVRITWQDKVVTRVNELTTVKPSF
ncbi:MAG: prepilin-type N-terminal cleavage/methylation domain-containing protein [Deltaproteobacteria bacterium]|nr:MAG: prepilin-type N-terminal cleavage/methylation domain-containing protein [Deltaproteobacteria bacterium]